MHVKAVVDELEVIGDCHPENNAATGTDAVWQPTDAKTQAIRRSVIVAAGFGGAMAAISLNSA